MKRKPLQPPIRCYYLIVTDYLAELYTHRDFPKHARHHLEEQDELMTSETSFAIFSVQRPTQILFAKLYSILCKLKFAKIYTDFYILT